MNNEYLIKEKEGKLLLKFAVPCILSLLISALYNIVDQIFIGNSSVGAIGNTATTIIFPLTVIALAFALMLGDGGAAFMSLCMGKGEGKKINQLVGTLITISVVISAIFLFICFPLLDQITSFFGAKAEESLKYTHEYGFIILMGVPFYIIMNMPAKYGAQSKYGINDPQAIIGVVMKLFTIVVNISVGISAGAQPIIGYNYGAGQKKKVKNLFFMIIGLNIILGLIATVLFETIPGPILSIFGTNSTNPTLYKEFGIMTMRIYLMLITFTILQKSVSIFLQAMGSPVEAAILSLSRDVVAMVNFTIILPIFWGIKGIL